MANDPHVKANRQRPTSLQIRNEFIAAPQRPLSRLGPRRRASRDEIAALPPEALDLQICLSFQCIGIARFKTCKFSVAGCLPVKIALVRVGARNGKRIRLRITLGCTSLPSPTRQSS